MNDRVLNNVFYFFLFLILFLFAAFRPIGLDPDSQGYYNWVVNDLYLNRSELSFVLIVDFWGFFLQKESIPRMVFVSYAFLHLTILHLAFRNYTYLKFQSLLLFFFLLYSISLLTQIRIGIASAVFFWAIKDIESKNIILYLLKMILAFSFHSMALMFFLFYFVGSVRLKKWIYLSALPIGLLSLQFIKEFKVFAVNHLVQYLPSVAAKKINSYLTIEEQSISLFNFWFIYVLIVYYCLVFVIDRMDKSFYTYLNVIFLGIFLYFSTNFMSILSIRIINSAGLLVLIIVPQLISVYKPKIISGMFFYGCAFLIFLNWHFRNQLLDFDVFFK